MAAFAQDQNQAEKATVALATPESSWPRSPTFRDGGSGDGEHRESFVPQHASNTNVPPLVSPSEVLQDDLAFRSSTRSRGVSPRSSDSQSRNYPVGHPLFARHQIDSHNGSFFRAFRYTRHRLLHYHQGRVAFLTKGLMEWEEQNQGHLNCLTTAQKRLPGQLYVPGGYDVWIEELDRALKQFDELLLRNRDIQTLYRVSDNERLQMMEQIRLTKEDGSTCHMFDAELYKLLDDQDDVIICTKKQVHASLDWLLYSKWFNRLLDNLFPTKDRRGHMLKQTRIVGFLKLVTVMTVNTLLIVPVMLLYFGNLSQVHSCLVVVSFTFLFTGVVSTRNDISPYSTFMASAAFVAVLSTFLAQLQIYTAN